MLLLAATLSLVIAADAVSFAPPDEPKPLAEQMRGAVDRSLPFLAKGGAKWREGTAGGGQNSRICVTCHQIPFTIWTHNEAQARGIAIDKVKHDDLTAWTLQWCASDKSPKSNTHTGGFLGTMQQLIMGRAASPLDKPTIETFTLFETVIGARQDADGFWKEGNQIVRDGAQREANEVDTMWMILGLDSLAELGEALPAATLASAAANRKRALSWLDEGAEPRKRTDWLVLRALIDRRDGDENKSHERLTDVLKRQNTDGGWPLVAGEASHAMVTGQVLYALSIAGPQLDADAIRRADQYLVDTQQADGSWNATSRREASKINIVTIHWATGWATIGLIRTLPTER